MQRKILLLASFVERGHVRTFLKNLENKHNIKKEEVFTYKISEDKILLTYKLKIDLGIRFDIKNELPKTIQIHKKKSSFFTINALNRLIELDNDIVGPNINHKDFKVEWSNYEDKIILLKDGGLDLIDIERVFLSDL